MDAGEELDYITTKVKSFINKINITDLEQSETLVDFSDLSTTTKKKNKAVFHNIAGYTILGIK